MSSSVTVTFIRHAESTDNLRPIFDRKDASLSKRGMKQARALGEFFADTQFTVIYASDLKRAFTTAQALYKQQKDPKPTYVSSELLRELDSGIAEGKPFSRRRLCYDTLEEAMKCGLYPNCLSKDEKYPGGESRVDLVERSKKAITQLLLPHVWKAAKEGSTDTHLAVVGHGLCLYEIIYELLQMSPNQAVRWKFQYDDRYDYLNNAAWTRIVINIEESHSIDMDQHPPMVMDVTDVNRHLRLYTTKRHIRESSVASEDSEGTDNGELEDITDNA
ncbi:histidine phosphatase superfamily [Lactifluus volemus]|nr:histidine phosphatase superfamily [Lactifluus volemus]